MTKAAPLIFGELLSVFLGVFCKNALEYSVKKSYNLYDANFPFSKISRAALRHHAEN